MSGIDPGIHELFARLEALYAAKDFAAVRALWVADLEAPFYLAEEHRPYMSSWADVEQYWQLTAEGLAHLRARFEPRVCTVVGERLRLVGFDLTWLARVGHDAPIAGTLRAAALCEHTAAGWRIRAWIEAPLAPIVYMRGLYEGVAQSLSVDGLGKEIKR